METPPPNHSALNANAQTKPFAWVWPYIKAYWPRFAAGLAICLVVSCLSLVNPYISGQLIKVIEDGTWEAALFGYVRIFLIVTALRAILRYSMLILFESASQRVVMNLRQDIYAWVHSQNYGFFDTNRVGDIMARMTGDLDAVRHFTGHVIFALFENVVIFFAAIAMMFSISWQLTLIMLSVAPVIVFCATRQSRLIKPAFYNIREHFSRLNSVCEENIGGNRVVKAFAKEEYEIGKFTAENQGFYDAQIKASDTWRKYLPWLDFCGGLLSVFLLLGGGILVILGRLELWQMVTVNGYLWAVSNPLRMSGWLLNDVQNFFASLDRISTMMRKRIYISSPEKPASNERPRGKVEFRDVSFGYDRNNLKALALKNISFTAQPGSTIGIVGATGSGKTTLVNLIGRYYDAISGEVLVDGVNVKGYSLSSLRSGIASAAQDVFLFSDTVEGNIAYGAPEAPLGELVEAAVAADADGFILELENGYDTIVGERGVGLSGGQKQRLSLARALAVNPSILILDDTTSAVDMETEHEIQQALKRYKDQTTFIIAHRISSVKSADQILVMENGGIIERGTHNELVAQKGYYYSLFINQYGEYAKGQVG